MAITLPNGADGLSELISLVFPTTGTDGSIPQQQNNDQPTVEAMLKGQMQESSGWNSATSAGFAGLPSGIPMVLGIIAKLAEQITGIPVSNWVTQWLDNPVVDALGDLVQDALSTVFSVLANLQAMFSALNFLDPDFDPEEAIQIWIDSISDIISAVLDFLGLGDVYEAITGLILGDTDDPQGVLNQLFQFFPSDNVTGIGGPTDIGASIQETWDQLISGFVGLFGSGSGLSDLFNVSNEVSSRATRGEWSWDILGIRNNKPLWAGLFPTSESNIGLDKVGLASSAPTFAVTQSTAITAFQRISEAASKGVVSWLGSGITSITHAFVNIYRMNTTTGDMTLVHESVNIAGDLSGSMQYNVYEVDPPIAVLPGEVYGIELAVRGAGTHSMVGSATWLPDHPTVYPKRLSAVRNSGTSAAPSTITSGSVVYTTNVPFMEFGVTSGDSGTPHSPQTVLFNTVGTTTIVVPTWCEEVEVIAIGSGGGGGGGGELGFPGAPGGGPGSWATTTWVRGTDFTSDVTIHITVPAGGNGDDGVFGGGTNGGSAVVTLSGNTVTAAGGVCRASPGQFGAAAGNQVYNSIVYAGGVQQNTAGAGGAAPGGGGSSGGDFFLGNGGAGGKGSVWIRFLDTVTSGTAPTGVFPYNFPFPLS